MELYLILSSNNRLLNINLKQSNQRQSYPYFYPNYINMDYISIAKLHRYFLSSTGISTDTRKIQYGEMFFCLKGENFNANKFANKALENGALYVIIDEEEYYIDERTILVTDALEYLQLLAAFHRRQFDIPFIGITGTNGKTTTKELVNAVLSKHFKTHATQGNFNNHIGVPLTILSIPNDAEIAIIEMGANHIGEIAELCKIAGPNYGLITSIGRAHLEGFGSLEGVIKAKSELYKYIENNSGKVFVSADNELLIKLSEGLDRITYGENTNATTKGEMILDSAFATVQWQDNKIVSQLVGTYNFDNIMAAISIGDYFQMDKKQITEALINYQPNNKRSQWQKTNNNELILDAYNANPSSMEVAINSLNAIESDNKWLILGDMLELGAESEMEHKKILLQLKSYSKSNIILVGPEMQEAAKSQGFNAFENTDEAIIFLNNNPIKGALILVKGSRGIALEKLIDYL